MIARIKNDWLRRAVVILTVAALILCLSGLWLAEAIAKCICEDFGEDLKAAWHGKRKRASVGCTCPPGKSCYERCGE